MDSGIDVLHSELLGEMFVLETQAIDGRSVVVSHNNSVASNPKIAIQRIRIHTENDLDSLNPWHGGLPSHGTDTVRRKNSQLGKKRVIKYGGIERFFSERDQANVGIIPNEWRLSETGKKK